VLVQAHRALVLKADATKQVVKPEDERSFLWSRRKPDRDEIGGRKWHAREY
jgi:hypothetical protein